MSSAFWSWWEHSSRLRGRWRKFTRRRSTCATARGLATRFKHPFVAFARLGLRLLARLRLARDVDVEVFPRVLPRGVLLVAEHPRLQQRVLDRVEPQPPGVVGGDDLRHPAIE